MPKTSSTVTALTHARRKPADFSAYAQPVAAAAVDMLEAAMGGRAALVAALVSGPSDPDLDYVVGLIADPRHDAQKLSAVCALGRVTVGQVLEAYKRGVLASAQVAAIHRVAASIPKVVDDVMTRAQPHYVQCGSCNGVGTRGDTTKPDAPPSPCTACNGTGSHFTLPELDRQKVALELGKLLTKGPMVVAQTNHYERPASSASPAAFGSLMAAVDKILHPGRVEEDADVVDGEMVGTPTTPASPPDTSDTTPPADCGIFPTDGGVASTGDSG